MQIDSEEALRNAIKLPSELEGLEFKHAENQFSKDRLCEYVSALANEGGGSIVLGVTDRKPREFAGTNAFPDLAKLRFEVFERMRWRTQAQEFHPDGKRVVVVSTNAAPRGRPVGFDGKFYHRTGEALRTMGPDELRRALVDVSLDVSSDVCAAAKIDDLDPKAVERFRLEWSAREPKLGVSLWDVGTLLENAELSVDGELTNAALLLMGAEQAIRRHLPQAEMIFEYRSKEGMDEYSERLEFKAGLLLWVDSIWQRINVRNTTSQITLGLFRHEVATFDEGTIREALLNAVAHRDYSDAGSAWLLMWPTRIEVRSPGGFPRGITPENIVDRQNPRNRRLAEALKRCGLVERSGQGADKMFRRCIEQAKALPDYSKSDEHVVIVNLRGEVTDPKFIQFLEDLSRERGAAFSVADLRVLDMVRRGVIVPETLLERREVLRSAGAIERTAGRNKWILSRRYREFEGVPDAYDRDRGRGRAEEVQLLRRIIVEAGNAGATRKQLNEAVDRSSSHVGRLLGELKKSGVIETRGRGSGARWHARSS